MRALSRDVSVHEMWQLRKDGWSNYEISQKTGCAEATVRKYLGCQPKECRGSRIGQVVPQKKEAAVAKEKIKILFPITGIELKGKACGIKLDLVKIKCAIVNKCGEIQLDGRYLSDLISDLEMAKKALEQYGGENRSGVSRVPEKQEDPGGASGV